MYLPAASNFTNAKLAQNVMQSSLKMRLLPNGFLQIIYGRFLRKNSCRHVSHFKSFALRPSACLMILCLSSAFFPSTLSVFKYGYRRFLPLTSQNKNAACCNQKTYFWLQNAAFKPDKNYSFIRIASIFPSQNCVSPIRTPSSTVIFRPSMLAHFAKSSSSCPIGVGLR